MRPASCVCALSPIYIKMYSHGQWPRANIFIYLFARLEPAISRSLRPLRPTAAAPPLPPLLLLLLLLLLLCECLLQPLNELRLRALAFVAFVAFVGFVVFIAFVALVGSGSVGIARGPLRLRGACCGAWGALLLLQPAGRHQSRG
jgi:hypothetical protein